MWSHIFVCCRWDSTFLYLPLCVSGVNDLFFPWSVCVQIPSILFGRNRLLLQIGDMVLYIRRPLIVLL